MAVGQDYKNYTSKKPESEPGLVSRLFNKATALIGALGIAAAVGLSDGNNDPVKGKELIVDLGVQNGAQKLVYLGGRDGSGKPVGEIASLTDAQLASRDPKALVTDLDTLSATLEKGTSPKAMTGLKQELLQVAAFTGVDKDGATIVGPLQPDQLGAAESLAQQAVNSFGLYNYENQTSDPNHIKRLQPDAEKLVEKVHTLRIQQEHAPVVQAAIENAGLPLEVEALETQKSGGAKPREFKM